MANAWFETVAVAQGRARKRLPKSVYGALVAGSEKGVTVRDNVAAFSELGFAPHVAGLSAQRDLSTTVMGHAARRRDDRGDRLGGHGCLPG
jgi:pre-mycofactocin synthase